MTRRILFRPEAEAELADAVTWYEARSRGLGAEFLRAVDAALAAILRRPQASPKVLGSARRALLRRFPYSVIFLVTDAEIVVVACIHGSRNPKRWQERVR